MRNYYIFSHKKIIYDKYYDVDHKKMTLNYQVYLKKMYIIEPRKNIIMKDIKMILQEDFPLSPQSMEELLSIAKISQLKKYQILLREGEICDHWGYITKGLLRSYYRKDNREITEYFSTEGDRFVSIESYYRRVPSQIIIEALEPTEICAFQYDEYEILCQNNPEIGHFTRKIMENSLIWFQRRLDSLQFESAYKKYQHLSKTIPRLTLRASSVHIASYLGITPETLSRVRTRKM